MSENDKLQLESKNIVFKKIKKYLYDRNIKYGKSPNGNSLYITIYTQSKINQIIDTREVRISDHRLPKSWRFNFDRNKEFISFIFDENTKNSEWQEFIETNIINNSFDNPIQI